MSKARRIFQLACRFGLGFLIGLTTLFATVVTGMLVLVLYQVDYGPVIAIVAGCSTSGILFMLTLWAYRGDYGEPPPKKMKGEKTDAD